MYRLSIRYDDGTIDDEEYSTLSAIRGALLMLKRLKFTCPKPVDYVIIAQDGSTMEEGPVYDSD